MKNVSRCGDYCTVLATSPLRESCFYRWKPVWGMWVFCTGNRNAPIVFLSPHSAVPFLYCDWLPHCIDVLEHNACAVVLLVWRNDLHHLVTVLQTGVSSPPICPVLGNEGCPVSIVISLILAVTSYQQALVMWQCIGSQKGKWWRGLGKRCVTLCRTRNSGKNSNPQDNPQVSVIKTTCFTIACTSKCTSKWKSTTILGWYIKSILRNLILIFTSKGARQQNYMLLSTYCLLRSARWEITSRHHTFKDAEENIEMDKEAWWRHALLENSW